MNQIAMDQLNNLLGAHQPPCISLYLPTHRQYPDRQQDPIRYRNLLDQMEESLRENHGTRDIRPLVEKFHELTRDAEFWNHRTDALGILGAGDLFEVFDLQRPVDELLVIADRFHIKPILRVLQSTDRYQVLCLNRHEARLFEGNRYVLDPVELSQVPSTVEAALGEEITEPHLTVASYGKGAGGPHSAHGEPGMHHGHGGRKDEIELDMDRFFRVIDRGILEHHSRPSGLPLLLAALPEYHTPFRKISRNPFLMEAGIEVNPDALNLAQLRSAAWEAMEPVYQQRLAELAEKFRTARARQQGSDDLAQVAEAAATGRVATLLVEANREIPGTLEITTGKIDPSGQSGQANSGQQSDLLNDIAALVLQMKGEVVVVPDEQMPAKSGLAAIFRY